MARIVVLGYGNPLRGDDGVGWRVAEAVANRWPGYPMVRTGHQLVPEWAADLHTAEFAYFVDASVEAGRPKLEPVALDGAISAIDGHSMHPAQLLRLTYEVFGHAPSAFVLHVPAARFGFGDALSPVATTGVSAAIRALRQHCRNVLATASNAR